MGERVDCATAVFSIVRHLTRDSNGWLELVLAAVSPIFGRVYVRIFFYASITTKAGELVSFSIVSDRWQCT